MVYRTRDLDGTHMLNSGLSIDSSAPTPAPVTVSLGGSPLRVVLLYRRNCPSEERLVWALERHLIREGFAVFIDRHLALGVNWATEIEAQIRTADAVVPLISAASSTSEMLCFEVENAHETAQSQKGRPKLFPVRVEYTGQLPEPLAGILDPIQYLLWEDKDDDTRIAEALTNALRALATAKPVVRLAPSKGLRLVPRPAIQPIPRIPLPLTEVRPLEPLSLEAIGGAMSLTSEFYVTRSADAELKSALIRYDSIILVKGGRQIGKTSMLARGLQFARERGAKVALTDFQKFNSSNLESVGNFYLSLAESISDQLELKILPADSWDEKRGPNVNFERFMRKEVLGHLNAPLVWGLDEVDRLFVCSYASEVFGLFRSWHNERALDPAGPWSGLTLAIAYATEAHLFITDMNQSPFNVGTRLSLDDFDPGQLRDLNQRYGSPLSTDAELERFHRLLEGHPFLSRRSLHQMTTKKLSLSDFETEATRDEGIFGDHLRRILVLLAKDPGLTDALRSVLKGHPCPTPESFYRLRSAGVISGSSQLECRPRCQLYATYLSRHLL